MESENKQVRGDGSSPPLAADRLVAALWRHRWVTALVVLVCTGAAAAGVLVRPTRWQAQAVLAIGTIPPVRGLEAPSELASRLSSLAQVYELIGETPRPPQDPDLLKVSGEVLSDERSVQFVVEAPTAERARDVLDRATKAVLSRHARLFDAIREANDAEVDSFRRLQERLQADLAARTLASRERPEGARPVAAALLATEKRDTCESQLVDVSKHAAALAERNLEPRARRTRIVYGPEEERVRPAVGLTLATLLGLFSGLLLAAFLVAVLERPVGGPRAPSGS